MYELIFIKNYAGGGDDEDEEMLDEDDDDEGDLDEYVNCQIIVSSVVQRLQVVGRRRPIVQNSSLCHETFVLYHRNAARAAGSVIQRGFSSPYLPVRRSRGDSPLGGLGNVRHPPYANSAIWRRAANQRLSRGKAKTDPGRFRTRGNGLLPPAGPDTCVGQSPS